MPIFSKSDESDQQVPPVELFEFLNVSFNALKDALAQLRSSPDSELRQQRTRQLSPLRPLHSICRWIH